MTRLGEFSITRVPELERPMFRPEAFFPDLTDDMLARARRELPEDGFAEDGRIMLSFHAYVVRTGRHTIVVDTCCGNDKERAGRDEFNRLNTDFLGRLARAGIAPESVDYVMCTHLHWDHVGWNTRLLDGRWVPTFPNARVVVSRTEYDYWQAAMDRGESSPTVAGLRDSVLPIRLAGKLDVVADDHALEDGVWLAPCHGHSPGHVVVNMRSGGRCGVFAGDVIHHRIQLLYPHLSTRSDHDMDLARATRTALVASHADTGNLVMTGHFPTPSIGRIVSAGAAYDFVPV